MKKTKYWTISFYSKDTTFNELVIKNPLVKKETIFVLMEGFHLPHRQISLWEDRIFHCKMLFPLSFVGLKQILQWAKSRKKMFNAFYFQSLAFSTLKRSKPSHKNYSHNSSPTSLECMSRGIMTKINVCKTIRQKIYVVFYDMKCLVSTVTRESGRVPSHKSGYFVISKIPWLYRPHHFHAPCIALFTVYFHAPCAVLFTMYLCTVISMFLFLFYWLYSKVSAVNQIIQLCFYQRFTIGQ